MSRRKFATHQKRSAKSSKPSSGPSRHKACPVGTLISPAIANQSKLGFSHARLDRRHAHAGAAKVAAQVERRIGGRMPWSRRTPRRPCMDRSRRPTRVLMIMPLRSISLGRSARVRTTSPVMLVSITVSSRSHCVAGRGSVGGARPALFSNKSMLLVRAAAWSRSWALDRPHGRACRFRSGRKLSPSSSCNLFKRSPRRAVPMVRASPRKRTCGREQRLPPTIQRWLPVTSTVFGNLRLLRAVGAPLTRSAGRTPKLNRRLSSARSGSYRLKKTQDARKGVLARLHVPAILPVPDSGQIEETLRPACVTKRCRKCGEATATGSLRCSVSKVLETVREV